MSKMLKKQTFFDLRYWNNILTCPRTQFWNIIKTNQSIKQLCVTWPAGTTDFFSWSIFEGKKIIEGVIWQKSVKVSNETIGNKLQLCFSEDLSQTFRTLLKTGFKNSCVIWSGTTDSLLGDSDKESSTEGIIKQDINFGL